METQPLGSVPSMTAGMVGPARPVQITNKDEALSFIKGKESISSVKELDPLIKYFNLPGTSPSTIGDILSKTPDMKLFAVCTYWRTTSQKEISGFREDASGVVAYRDKVDAALGNVKRPFTTVSGTEIKEVNGLRRAADVLYNAMPSNIVKSILNKDGTAGIEGLYNSKTPESGDVITVLNHYMQDTGPRISGVVMQNGKASLYTISEGESLQAQKKAEDVLGKIEMDDNIKSVIDHLPRDKRIDLLTKIFSAEEEAKIEQEKKVRMEEDYAGGLISSIGVEGGLYNLALDAPDAPPELAGGIRSFLELVESGGGLIPPIESETPTNDEIISYAEGLKMPGDLFMSFVQWIKEKPHGTEMQ